MVALEDILKIAKEETGQDLNWVLELQKEVPEGGEIAVELASKLFVKFWSAITSLTDIFILVRRYENDAKGDRDKYFSILKETATEEKSDAAKTRKAEADPRYQELCNRRDKASELREWIQLKREDFVKAHYMCKEVVVQHREITQSTPDEEVQVEV